MDISLREWLIIGGVLIVILILVDGWRRVSANRSRLRLEIDRTLSELGDADAHNPELPNGGARKRGGESSQATAEQSSSDPLSARQEPRMDEPVEPAPQLSEMDPLFDDIPDNTRHNTAQKSRRNKKPAPEKKPEAAAEPEPKAYTPGAEDELLQAVDRGELSGAELEMEYPLSEESVSAPRPAAGHQAEQGPLDLDLDQPIPTLFDQVELPNDTLAAYRDSVERDVEQASEPDSPVEEAQAADDASTAAEVPASEGDEAPVPDSPAPAEEATEPKRKGPSLSSLPDPEHVLVITVVARNGERLPGPALDKIVTACGMEWGDMSIYHRAEDNTPGASVQFSMANAVAPGTFDPDNLAALETPAVSFFMSMNEPNDPMTAYECMLATAETLAKHLDGDLLDEDRSVMRPQTKEHYRERIREFQMHQRQRRAN